MQAIEHAHTHADTYLEGFLDLLRMKSVSTDPQFAGEVRQTAEWLAQHMQTLGFEHVATYDTEGGHPIVYGDWLHAGDDQPTVLIYAHYDVQPPGDNSRWTTDDPFDPTIMEDKLIARGVADDKQGVWFTLKACQSLLEADGALPCNIKLFFEGMEEAGSRGVDAFIADNRDLVAADLIIINDGAVTPDEPLIVSGVRGIIGTEVTVKTLERDVHSGMLGGVAHNPLHKIGEIIASLHDENGHIRIPGFYDDVAPPDEATRAGMAAADEQVIERIRTSASAGFIPWGEDQFPLLERITYRPTLDVNGIYGGYQDEGMMTIIPAEGGFKVTMRLVPDQNPDDIIEAFTAHVMAFDEPTAAVTVTIHEGAYPSAMLDAGHPMVEAQQAAYETVWGRRAVVRRTGGSIPIVSFFAEHLPDTDISHMAVGVGGYIHSPNEYLYVDYIQKGIDLMIHTLVNISEV